MIAEIAKDTPPMNRISTPRSPTLTMLCALCATLLLAGPAVALHIRAYDPARHDRFESGYPSNPTFNTNFHAGYHDFSGVGWKAIEHYLSYTLISPLHFVGANHVKPGIGATLVFQGRDGALRSYTVANQYNITNSAGEDTDLFIGELSQPVQTCDNIRFYPILNLPSEAEYVGRDIQVYGHEARVGTGTINSILSFGGDPITGGAGVNDTRTYKFAFVNAAGGADDCHVEGGDSGSPSFVVMNGELFVVGVHLAVLSTGLASETIDTFVPHYLDQITAILGEQGHQPATTAADAFRLCYELTPLSPNSMEVSWIGHRGRVYELLAATNDWDFQTISGSLTAEVSRVSFVDSDAMPPLKLYRVRRMD